MNRKAVIDIGSNSVKLYAAEKMENGQIRCVLNESAVTMLGKNLYLNRCFLDENKKSTEDTVVSFVEKARKAGAGEIDAVATMAMRISENSEELIKDVEERCGIRIRVLPGEEEARLSHKAAVSGIRVNQDEYVVFDTGGGSTEFVFCKEGKIVKQFSTAIGAASLTERFSLNNAVGPEIVNRAEEYAIEYLESCGVVGHPIQLIGIGGTVTALASMTKGLKEYKSSLVHSYELKAEAVNKHIELLRTLSENERKSITGLPAKRAPIVLGGSCIVHAIFELLSCNSLVVSDRGLRHGRILEMFE